MYVVYYASAGCLPDNEPVEFDTAEEAMEFVRQTYWGACEIEGVMGMDRPSLEAALIANHVPDPQPGSLYAWSIDHA